MPVGQKNRRRTPRSTDQYQHFIPRFILRRFQVGPAKSKAERKREFRRTGIDPEYVLYYDIASGTLDTRPLGKVYGVQNLYEDIRNQENVNELEEKLAVLEREAASIISDVHVALPTRNFSIKRRPLEALRKFLFIMHYRQAAVAPVYFQEDHPENVGGRQWIEHFKKSKGLKTAVDAWLYMLRFYLDNSHSQLMLLGAKIVEKYGMHALFEFLAESHIPPEIEDFPAVTYQTFAGGYFMCIWEAAEGDEFVVTCNGFGLWEGCVLVNGKSAASYGLRSLICVSAPMLSDLLDVTQSPPETDYARQNPWINSATISELESYRTSKQAEDDLFTFPITKLSRSQTMAVNEVLLRNVRSSLTFLSKDSMLPHDSQIL
ncbi:hypothetical protein BU15DRAFT_61679 [Melanogaster broomeanus]|nr:hypothetical protein BU15DRAFT_61679 [Melanogaster broomeanus]